MHQILTDEMRERLNELSPHAGDLVSVKYSGGAHAITVVGQFGKSMNAPYIIKSDGEEFALRPKVVFTQSEYEFTSIDFAIPSQREEFLQEVRRNGVKLPFPMEGAESGDAHLSKEAAERQAARRELLAKKAISHAGDARGAIQDIRARIRQRREQ